MKKLFRFYHFPALSYIISLLLFPLQIGILAEALGGVNVGNCGHACEARPCGDAECRPMRDRFTCRCRPGAPHPCPAHDEHSSMLLHTSRSTPESITSATFQPPSSSSPIITTQSAVPSFTGMESYLHFDDADTMKR